MKNAPLVVATLVSAAVLGAAAPTAARPVAGVELPDTVTVDGKALKLNGAGLRKKVIVKVYAGALYTENAVKSAKEIIGPDQAWAVRMHFLRSVGKDAIFNTYKDGFEKNSKDQLAELAPGLDKLRAALIDVKDGTVMTVTHAPGQGVTIAIQGGPSLAIDGKAFADAMLKNWIGEFPGDAGLKRDLLAGP